MGRPVKTWETLYLRHVVKRWMNISDQRTHWVIEETCCKSLSRSQSHILDNAWHIWVVLVNSSKANISNPVSWRSSKWITDSCLLHHSFWTFISSTRTPQQGSVYTLQVFLIRLYPIFAPLLSAGSCFYGGRLAARWRKCCIAALLQRKGHSTYNIWMRAYITQSYGCPVYTMSVVQMRTCWCI